MTVKVEGGAAPPPPAQRAEGDGPILDKNDQNVAKPRMGGKHYRSRGKIRDAMRWWRRHGMKLWWCTLTSSPGSDPGRLRKDFQTWKQRIERAHRLERGEVQYVMVDTSEGHGVLHFVLAIPEESRGPWRYQIDYKECGEWWLAIHGARQVKFLEVGKGEGDTRRLSQYIVSQYMVSQTGETVDLIGRISSSRFRVSFSSLRRKVHALCTTKLQAYRYVNQFGALGAEFETVWSEYRKSQYRVFRQMWAGLLEHGHCLLNDERYLIENGDLVKL